MNIHEFAKNYGFCIKKQKNTHQLFVNVGPAVSIEILLTDGEVLAIGDRKDLSLKGDWVFFPDESAAFCPSPNGSMVLRIRESLEMCDVSLDAVYCAIGLFNGCLTELTVRKADA